MTNGHKCMIGLSAGSSNWPIKATENWSDCSDIKVVSAALLNSPVSTLRDSASSNALVLSYNLLVHGP
jgi:hypothetical protein